MNKVTPDSGWMTTKSNAFWDDIATSDHIVQIYDSEAGFLETLAGFAGAGINAGDSIVIVATRPHLNALEERLTAHGIHIPSLIANAMIAASLTSSVMSSSVNFSPSRSRPSIASQ